MNLVRSPWRSELGRGLWTFRTEVLWVGFFGLVANLLMLTPTLYMLQVFDRVMLSQNELTLLAVTLVMTLFVTVMAVAEWVRSRLLVRAGVRFDEALNARVFDASFAAHLAQDGASATRAFSDLTNLRQFLTGPGIITFFDLPWLPIYLGVLFVMHPWLGWTGIAFTLVFIGLAIGSHLLTASLHEIAADSELQANNYLSGKLRHTEVVESMGMIPNLRRRWIGLVERQFHGREQSHQQQQRIQALGKFLQYSQQSLILALGAWLAIQGEISLGAMIASNALMANALRPINSLVGTWKQLIEARLAYKRLDKVIVDYPDSIRPHIANHVAGQLEIRNLVAVAPGSKVKILKGLSFVCDPGEVIGIVGPSGAGKSTLIRCLIGVWPNTAGEVLLDGIDIGQWDRDFLGPHIGYLPQDIELLEGTAAENICRFGETDTDKVIEAARRAGIHEMIQRLPQGYDTPLLHAGGLFSGGQRQRLALARALYGMPALVALDEPNANLDDVGEAALAKAIFELKRAGKTVLMVLHQPHLLSLADRVLVLNQGVIEKIARKDIATRSEDFSKPRTV
jgi:ATP-binding cassette subfamily C exporter for protease/lipase